VTFILLNWTKYYTRKIFRFIRLLIIAFLMILGIVVIKYKPSYEVDLSGEKLGYIDNKDVMVAKLDKYMNSNENNVAFREIPEYPSYSFKFINRGIKENNEEIINYIKNTTTSTYKYYAIISDGEEKAVVNSNIEAETIINEIKNGLNPEIDLKLGIVEKYVQEENTSTADDAKNCLNQLKISKVTEYEKQKAEEARKKEEEKKKLLQARSVKYLSNASLGTSTGSGNISGRVLNTPVGGMISSRFGERSSRRSSVHTGLDIATSLGTGFRPIMDGTVVFAGYSGSYGNIIKIDHGDGIQSWYAHCSAIYVGVGQSVSAGTTIGAVGSTGNSTGPHLHLEIRINGTPVNPQNYLYR